MIELIGGPRSQDRLSGVDQGGPRVLTVWSPCGPLVACGPLGNAKSSLSLGSGSIVGCGPGLSASVSPERLLLIIDVRSHLRRRATWAFAQVCFVAARRRSGLSGTLRPSPIRPEEVATGSVPRWRQLGAIAVRSAPTVSSGSSTGCSTEARASRGTAILGIRRRMCTTRGVTRSCWPNSSSHWDLCARRPRGFQLLRRRGNNRRVRRRSASQGLEGEQCALAPWAP